MKKPTSVAYIKRKPKSRKAGFGSRLKSSLLRKSNNFYLQGGLGLRYKLFRLCTQNSPFLIDQIDIFSKGRDWQQKLIFAYLNNIQAILNIHASNHNIILTLTSCSGNCIGWTSGGQYYKKAKRGSSLSSSLAAKQIAKMAKKNKIARIGVHFNGLGQGNLDIVQELKKNKIKILYLKDVTSVSHNGCRPPKVRRNKSINSEALME